MYAHYESIPSTVATVDRTATNKMRDLLHGILGKSSSFTVGGSSGATVYNSIMTDLYATYTSTKAKASGWDATANTAFNDAMEKATAYYNASTYTEGDLFLSQLAKVKSIWTAAGEAGDATAAGSAAKSFLDY